MERVVILTVALYKAKFDRIVQAIKQTGFVQVEGGSKFAFERADTRRRLSGF